MHPSVYDGTPVKPGDVPIAFAAPVAPQASGTVVVIPAYAIATGDGGERLEYVHGVAPTPPSQGQIECGRWTVGICDCCDSCVPNFLMSLCCPCVSMAQVYARLGLLPYKTALWRMSLWVIPFAIARLMINSASDTASDYSYSTNTDVYNSAESEPDTAVIKIAYVLLLIGQIAFSLPVFRARGKIRQRFQIPGDTCGDCCISWWCTNCAIAQMATHVHSYRPGDCSFAPPEVLPAYSAQ